MLREVTETLTPAVLLCNDVTFWFDVIDWPFESVIVIVWNPPQSVNDDGILEPLKSRFTCAIFPVPGSRTLVAAILTNTESQPPGQQLSWMSCIAW